MGNMNELGFEARREYSSLDEKAVGIIQSSWNNMVGKEEAVVSRFYKRLFSEHPEYRPLFTRDMTTQRAKFLSMLNLIVNGLDNLEVLAGPLDVLGKKHRAMGIKKADYKIVANTLVNAIEDVSDQPLSEQEHQSWGDGLMLIASIMMDESLKK